MGITATIGANVAHGLNHGPIGALASAWPALALVGSFELLMMLTRSAASATVPWPGREHKCAVMVHDLATCSEPEPTPADAVLADYLASLDGPGRPLSQRFLAEKHGMDRRKVKQIISTVAHAEPV